VLFLARIIDEPSAAACNSSASATSGSVADARRGKATSRRGAAVLCNTSPSLQRPAGRPSAVAALRFDVHESSGLKGAFAQMDEPVFVADHSAGLAVAADHQIQLSVPVDIQGRKHRVGGGAARVRQTPKGPRCIPRRQGPCGGAAGKPFGMAHGRWFVPWRGCCARSTVSMGMFHHSAPMCHSMANV